MCLESLIQQLTKEGFKVTPQRKLLLEILHKKGGHLSAEDIFEEIRSSQPNVSFGTVYRNLGILCDLGVVTQLDFKDGRSRFEISSGHHHHLVCLDCGSAIDVPMCPFSKTISDTANANNFSIKHHNFEVYGYCEECREKEDIKDSKEETRGKNQEERK